MKYKVLPYSFINSLGNHLQQLYREHFSEDYMNNILRLILDHMNNSSDNDFKNNEEITGQVTIACCNEEHLYDAIGTMLLKLEQGACKIQICFRENSNIERHKSFEPNTEKNITRKILGIIAAQVNPDAEILLSPVS